MPEIIGSRDYPNLNGLNLPTALIKAITRVYNMVYDLRDAVAGTKVYSLAYQGVTQSLANGGVATKLLFNTNAFTVDPLHVAGTGDFIATVPGLYLAICNLSWPSDTTGTYRSLLGEVNGALPTPVPIVTGPQAGAGSQLVEQNLSFPVFLKKGDAVQFYAVHNAAGNLNTGASHTFGSLILLNRTTS